MTDANQHIFELMKELDFCMLVTQPAAGLHARPMSAIVDAEVKTVHLLTGLDSIKDEEIAENPDVMLTFSNGSSKNVVLHATARISEDRTLIKSLWNPGAQAFWPDGPTDPNVAAIVITPTHGEYWEGNTGVVAAFKFAAAIAGGKPVDGGTNEKVTL
jgi:general stress protein 26